MFSGVKNNVLTFSNLRSHPKIFLTGVKAANKGFSLLLQSQWWRWWPNIVVRMMMMMMMMMMVMVMMMGEPSSQICQDGIKGRGKKLGGGAATTLYLILRWKVFLILAEKYMNFAEKYFLYFKICWKVFLILWALLQALLESISHTLNHAEKYFSYFKLCWKVFLIFWTLLKIISQTFLKSISHTLNLAKKYISYFELCWKVLLILWILLKISYTSRFGKKNFSYFELHTRTSTVGVGAWMKVKWWARDLLYWVNFRPLLSAGFPIIGLWSRTHHNFVQAFTTNLFPKKNIYFQMLMFYGVMPGCLLSNIGEAE